MKKLLIILLIVFASFFQEVNAQDVTFYHNYSNYGWQVSDDAYCGVGEVYCGVFRSQYKNSHGYYEYYIWFQSNSYWPNCNYTRSYLKNINIEYYNSGYISVPNWTVSTWTVGNQTLFYTLFDVRPNVKFRITVEKIEPTEY